MPCPHGHINRFLNQAVAEEASLADEPHPGNIHTYWCLVRQMWLNHRQVEGPVLLREAPVDVKELRWLA